MIYSPIIWVLLGVVFGRLWMEETVGTIFQTDILILQVLAISLRHLPIQILFMWARENRPYVVLRRLMGMEFINLQTQERHGPIWALRKPDTLAMYMYIRKIPIKYMLLRREIHGVPMRNVVFTFRKMVVLTGKKSYMLIRTPELWI